MLAFIHLLGEVDVSIIISIADFIISKGGIYYI